MKEPTLSSWDKRLADILCFELQERLKLPFEPALLDTLILAVYRAVDQRRKERQRAKGSRQPTRKPSAFPTARQTPTKG